MEWLERALNRQMQRLRQLIQDSVPHSDSRLARILWRTYATGDFILSVSALFISSGVLYTSATIQSWGLSRWFKSPFFSRGSRIQDPSNPFSAAHADFEGLSSTSHRAFDRLERESVPIRGPASLVHGSLEPWAAPGPDLDDNRGRSVTVEGLEMVVKHSDSPPQSEIIAVRLDNDSQKGGEAEESESLLEFFSSNPVLLRSYYSEPSLPYRETFSNPLRRSKSLSHIKEPSQSSSLSSPQRPLDFQKACSQHSESSFIQVEDQGLQRSISEGGFGYEGWDWIEVHRDRYSPSGKI